MVQAQASADADLTNADIEGDVTGKVTIHAQSVGNAPKLTKAKFATQGSSQLAKV